MSTLTNKKIDLDWCRDFVSTKVFRFCPPTYKAKHPIWPGMVGIELEMMPFISSSLDSSKPQMVPLFGDKSLVSFLEDLLGFNPSWQPRRGDDGLLSSIGLGDEDQLTFEPGGQLEYSTKPFPCLQDAGKRLRQVQNTLKTHAVEFGIEFIQGGSHPWASAEDIGLQMNKHRYQAMDSYFKKIGPFGARMMRETCTIQVNLDFGSSENVLAKRYLAANLLAPLFTAIFANSPISLGQPNGFKTVRSEIWRHLDKTRTGFPVLKGIGERLDLAACVDAYLDHVLKAHVVFIESLQYHNPKQPLTFQKWMEEGYEGIYPSIKDFETHLTLHFPEVRPKGFLELRAMDCQGAAWQIVPASISAALLYDEDNLNSALDLMGEYEEQLGDLRQKATMGLDDVVLGKLASKVMKLALDGFTRLPPCYQGERAGKTLEAFAQKFTFAGKTPADDLLQQLKKSGDGHFTPKIMQQVQENWLSSV